MAPLYPWTYLYYQLAPLPSSFTSPNCLSGKTVIVTGANTGLGLEAARHFARLGPAKLILACRDRQKGDQAAWDIADDTGCPNVQSWEVDLASFDSVRLFAERFEKEGGGRLHLLVANAGVSLPWYEKTEDGWERMLRVNYIGTAHLTLRLLPFLLAASPSSAQQNGILTDVSGPRLVTVTSEMHYWAYDRAALTVVRVMDTLNEERRCRQWGTMLLRYGATKMMNILFTQALSNRLSQLSRPTQLTATTVNPGFCHSQLTRHLPLSLPIALLKMLIARPTSIGARTLVHAALAPELEGVRGVYLSDCMVKEAGDFAVSKAGKRAAQHIWGETLDVLFEADPGLKVVLRVCGIEAE
ncbi:NADP-binding protein [Dacryopinax primogenitus]|uniref:NADP-binding protein n=1 Tax=Dacryopinax primogenitus (strain DJM 731) TaxID=1858805 RepID=M5G1S6_DACPD|nr:NADP-binding protein [Dacryopinax primogenitus]EJT99841.1 NADP-binding protein [Dacryopinax primogenitus]